MKKIEVHNRCSDYDSYRAARVKSLFNAESGCNFDLEAELPADETNWRIGVIVGPSGSGKSSTGRQFWPDVPIADLSAGWPSDRPIVDAIAPEGDFNAVTAALSAVGPEKVPMAYREFCKLPFAYHEAAQAASLLKVSRNRTAVEVAAFCRQWSDQARMQYLKAAELAKEGK